MISEHVDILKKSYADETENVIDRVSKIHTRENMRLRRKLTKENKKSLAIMDENTNLRNELRKNEIDNSIFLGLHFGLSVHTTLIVSFRFDSAGLDSSFGRSIFWSLLRTKDFYSRNYQESFEIRIFSSYLKLNFGLNQGSTGRDGTHPFRKYPGRLRATSRRPVEA